MWIEVKENFEAAVCGKKLCVFSKIKKISEMLSKFWHFLAYVLFILFFYLLPVVKNTMISTMDTMAISMKAVGPNIALV